MTTTLFLFRLVAGVALGIFFYGGLWLGLKQISNVRYRILLMLASFSIRTLVVLAGFLVLVEHRWDYALACLTGFTIGRLAVMKRLASRSVHAPNA